MRERAFVTGATGYTGQAVVRELVRRDVECIAHVRPDSPQLEQWRARFTGLGATFDCTPWGDAEFDAVIRHYRPAFVFALLGTTRQRARRARRRGARDSYETVDYQLTSIALKATAKLSPDARFIYLSSVGVRAGTRNPYLAARWRLESELKQSGLRYVIAQPALITGADREQFRITERGAALAAQAVFAAAGALGFRTFTQRYATLTGPQLGRALVNAALDPSCTNVMLEVPQLTALSKA
ncbi:MAG: SDR family oxidoreductase [Gemmatimonadota bacterium]